MEQVFAQFNYGRWIVICPRCLALGITSAVEIKPGETIFVCPEEFPGTQATMLISHPQRRGAFRSVPDEDGRAQTRQAAIASGTVYEIAFPSEKSNIERTLRFRPRHAQNWIPGVSIDELRQENDRNGVINV